MKIKFKILTAIFALYLTGALLPKHISAQQADVSFQVFYDQLSPYGQWIEYPDYGYVWLPEAGADFAPYSTGGHWMLTEYGWTWASDYDWGWAPFHYGRWDYDDFYGWFWVPDNEWGPSWVTWRRADGYYGWAPMQPGLSISMSFGMGYDRYPDRWMFVRDRDFERPNINRYYVDRTVQNRIIVNSTVINTTYVDNRRHTTYASGPARSDVQRATGRTIKPAVIHENSKPGRDVRNGQLQMYRPEVARSGNNGQKAAPSRIVERKDVKHPSERTVVNQPGRVTPGNTNNRVQPVNNKVKPVNNNINKNQPTQPRNVAPVQNNQRQQQPKNVKPQNTQPVKNQPSKPRNVAPAQNNQRQQPNNVKPQQNTQPNKNQPSQPRNVAPAQNNQRQQHPANTQPQKNNNNSQSAQPRNVAPAQNNQRQQQPANAQPQNNNNKSQPAQPRNVAPGQNKQQPNNSRPANNNKKKDPPRNV